MSKKIKYVVTGLVTLLILFALVALALPYFLDANTFRPQIISAVQKAAGRDVQINGDLAWSFLPGFSIKAEQVQLDNPVGFTKKPALATIDELKLSVEILPFILSRSVVLHELTLNGANINLMTLPNGTTNWQDLFKPQSTPQQKSTPSSNNNNKSTTVNFNVDTFSVTNSLLTWNDQQQKQQWVFSDLNVNGNSFALAQEFPLSLNAKIQHPPSAQIINLDIQTNVNVNPEKNSYVLSALKVRGGLQDNGSTPVKNINLTLDKLQMDPETKQVTLSNMVFDGFGTHATGELHAEHNGQYPLVSGAFKLDQLSLAKIKITNINLPIKGQQGSYIFSPISSQLYGGKLTGIVNVNLAANTPRWHVNYQLANLQTQALFSEAFGYNRFTGTSQSNGELTAAGLDNDSLIQTLAGALQVQLSNGSLEGFDINYWWQVGNKLLTADTSLIDLTDHKHTAIDNMSASFNFNKGVGSTKNFQLYNNVIFVKGTGQIDMVRKYVNMTLYVSSNKNGQPSGTAIPLIMSGSFGNITIKPDEKTIAAMAAKALTSEVGKAATEVLSKNIPDELAAPFNNAVNKLLGQ